MNTISIHAQQISVLLPPLPYIKWGLIQDLKTKRRDSNVYTYIKRNNIYIKRKKERNNNIKEEKEK